MTSPLTVDQVKDFLRYDGAENDAALTILLKGGQSWIERHTDRLMTRREVTQSIPAFPTYIDLRWKPFVPDSLSIAYLDSAYIEQAFDQFAIVPSGEGARAVPRAAWPKSATGVRLTYTAGYPTPEEIPEVMIHALALYVGASDDDRSAMTAEGRGALTFLLEGLHSPVVA